MDIQTVKQISIAEYLHSMGYSPVRRQGGNLMVQVTAEGGNRGLVQGEHREKPLV